MTWFRKFSKFLGLSRIFKCSEQQFLSDNFDKIEQIKQVLGLLFVARFLFRFDVDLFVGFFIGGGFSSSESVRTIEIAFFIDCRSFCRFASIHREFSCSSSSSRKFSISSSCSSSSSVSCSSSSSSSSSAHKSLVRLRKSAKRWLRFSIEPEFLRNFTCSKREKKSFFALIDDFFSSPYFVFVDSFFSMPNGNVFSSRKKRKVEIALRSDDWRQMKIFSSNKSKFSKILFSSVERCRFKLESTFL